jgi:biopolymer transport protein ExbD
MRFDEKKDDDGVEQAPLNMTPMIDMVFLLLIFFLTATTFQQKEREKEIELAAAKKFSALSAETGEVVVNITRTGKMIVAGQAVNEEQLVAALRNQTINGKPPKVVIRPDKAARFEMCVPAMDACAKASVLRPIIAVTPAEEPGG